MPTYEYACRACKRHTEAVQSFTDPPLTECPHCGGELKRVFHPVGILLKGSGFYSTDNRSAKRTAGLLKDGGDAKDGTSESKPDPSSSKTEPGSGSGSGSSKAETSGSSDSAKPSTTPSKKDSPAKKPESKK